MFIPFNYGNISDPGGNYLEDSPTGFIDAASSAYFDEQQYTTTFSLLKSQTLGNLKTKIDPESGGITEAEANEIGAPYGLTFTGRQNLGFVNMLVERQILDRQAQSTLERFDPGLLGMSGLFTARLASNMVDPVNVAAMFIPIGGQVKLGATLARSAQRFKKGFIEGSVGTAIFEPAVLHATKLEQIDYEFGDSLLNVAFGGVIGGGLHTGVGKISDLLTHSSDMTRETLLREAIADIVEGRPVDVVDSARILDEDIRESIDAGEIEPTKPRKKPLASAIEEVLSGRKDLTNEDDADAAIAVWLGEAEDDVVNGREHVPIQPIDPDSRRVELQDFGDIAMTRFFEKMREERIEAEQKALEAEDAEKKAKVIDEGEPLDEGRFRGRGDVRDINGHPVKVENERQDLNLDGKHKAKKSTVRSLLEGLEVAIRTGLRFEDAGGVRLEDYLTTLRSNLKELAQTLGDLGFSGKLLEVDGTLFAHRGMQVIAVAFESHPDLVVKFTVRGERAEPIASMIQPHTFHVPGSDVAARQYLRGHVDKLRFAVVERLDIDRDLVEKMQHAAERHKDWEGDRGTADLAKEYKAFFEERLGRPVGEEEVGDLIKQYEDLRQRLSLKGALLKDDHGKNLGFRIHPDTGKRTLVVVDEGSVVPKEEIIERARTSTFHQTLLEEYNDLLKLANERVSSGELVIPTKAIDDDIAQEVLENAEAELKQLEAAGMLAAGEKQDVLDLHMEADENINKARAEAKAIENHAICVAQRLSGALGRG